MKTILEKNESIETGTVAETHPHALELEGVTLSFDEEALVLDDLSLQVPRGSTTVILGPSGAGKSTILRLALGLLKPNSGRVRVFGIDITDMQEREMRHIRHRIGMVFQAGALFDSLSVAENVAFCPIESHQKTLYEMEDQVRERLAYVGLEDAYDLMPSELSGGMAKRVAVARAIMCQPEVMLYDEGTSGLDPIASRRMNSLINRLRDDLQVTSVVVTHILRDALAVADSIVMIHQGRVVFQGTPEEIQKSDIPLVKEFISERGTV